MISAGTTSGSRSSRRVLVIEDSADSAECLRLLLEMAGDEVAVAATAREGVETAIRFRPDIVLCDISLEGELTGHDVAKLLKSDPRLCGCSLVALTGDSRTEVRLHSLHAGFDDFVTKPIDPPALMKLLAGLPDRSRGAGADS